MVSSVQAENVAALGAERPAEKFGALPSRKVLETLFGAAGGALPAERALMFITIATVVIAIIGVGFVMHAARPIMLPLAVSFILAILLAPVAQFFGRYGLPDSAGAGIAIALAVGALVFAILLVDKPAMSWLEKLPAVLDAAWDKLDGLQSAMLQVQEVSQQVEKTMADIGEQAAPAAEVVIRDAPSLARQIAMSARGILIQMMFVFVLAYFFLATRASFRVKAMAAQPTLKGKLRTARIFRDIQRKVGNYMLLMLMINTGLGVATTLSMIAIGMPYPVVWGVLAAILNFVPYLGPVMVTILLGMSGIVTYDTLQEALLPPAVYIALNFIESNFVTPSLVGVRMRISPLAIIVSIALLTWMWGPAGAVVAIPLLVVLKTVCDSIGVLTPVGAFIGEIHLVKGRKVGFCRIDTIPARPPKEPRPIDRHLHDRQRRLRAIARARARRTPTLRAGPIVRPA